MSQQITIRYVACGDISNKPENFWAIDISTPLTTRVSKITQWLERLAQVLRADCNDDYELLT